jgi:Mg2+/citrate symporter
MSNLSAIFFVVWMVALLVLVMFVWPKMDRQRIREHVEAHGGKVIEMESVWFRAAGRYGRTYDVTYTSRQGRRITASCMTSIMRGANG